jgi:hypothetical protein
MASNTNRLAGTAYLSVDGQTYMLRGDFEYSPSVVTRETAVGMDSVHGYIEKPIQPHISCTLSDSGGLSIAALNAMSNVTVVAELANGKTIIGRNMWTVDAQAGKATDGTVEVKWEGPQGAVTES